MRLFPRVEMFLSTLPLTRDLTTFRSPRLQGTRLDFPSFFSLALNAPQRLPPRCHLPPQLLSPHRVHVPSARSCPGPAGSVGAARVQGHPWVDRGPTDARWPCLHPALKLLGHVRFKHNWFAYHSSLCDFLTPSHVFSIINNSLLLGDAFFWDFL